MFEAFICDAARTPIGRYGGKLAQVRADDLGAIPMRALIERNPALDPGAIEEVFYGCANQAGEDNRNVARMSLLLAGLPKEVPGVTLNRLCASGLEAVGQAARAIRSGEMALAIAGGVESMTRAPYVLSKATGAFSRGQEMFDTTIGWRFVNPAMEAAYGSDSMPRTGENVAEVYRVKRDDQDAFAFRSQQRAAAAQAKGFFAEEIVPVSAPGRARAETLSIDKDEHPRAETSLELLASLKPLFPGGSITAGNASGVNDGAAALLIADADTAKAQGLTPRARILGMASSGVDPRIMGIGPITAIQKLLVRLNHKITDYDVVEINEAFASQALAVLRGIGLPDDASHVNPNGGAIALGHPLGMSGARIVMTLLHQLERTGGRLGMASLCVGVGQGMAMAIERI